MRVPAPPLIAAIVADVSVWPCSIEIGDAAMICGVAVTVSVNALVDVAPQSSVNVTVTV